MEVRAHRPGAVARPPPPPPPPRSQPGRGLRSALARGSAAGCLSPTPRPSRLRARTPAFPPLSLGGIDRICPPPRRSAPARLPDLTIAPWVCAGAAEFRAGPSCGGAWGSCAAQGGGGRRRGSPVAVGAILGLTER